jgi:hypothetical protein
MATGAVYASDAFAPSPRALQQANRRNRMRKIPFPKPATVLAAVALFVALSGTAVAAGIVAKAKFALNAGKLQGQTAAQVAALPGPASTAASLVASRTSSFSLAANDASQFTAACQSGEKAVGGGYTTNGAVISATSAPTSDGAGWQVVLVNIGSSAATGSTYAVCVK